MTKEEVAANILADLERVLELNDEHEGLFIAPTYAGHIRRAVHSLRVNCERGNYTVPSKLTVRFVPLPRDCYGKAAEEKKVRAELRKQAMGV